MNKVAIDLSAERGRPLRRDAAFSLLAVGAAGQLAPSESRKSPAGLEKQPLLEARAKVEAKDRLTTVLEVALVIEVMNLTTMGVKASRKKALLDGIKKSLPDPAYPGGPETLIAAE